VVGGEGVEGEQVLLGSLEQGCHLRQRAFKTLDRVAQELACLLARVGVEDRPDQGGQQRLLLTAGVPERLPEE
jgi:hypothetical protein